MPCTDEPTSQPLPSFAPSLLRSGPSVLLTVRLAGSRIARLPLCGLPEQRSDDRIQVEDVLRDAAGTADEIADETVELVNQPFLVGDDRPSIGLQVDVAPDVGHERLRVVRQPREDAHKVA